MASRITNMTSSPVKACNVCHKTESTDTKILNCSICKKAQYCSQDCQRKEWPEHKKICLATKQIEKKADPDTAKSTLSEDPELKQLIEKLEKLSTVNVNPFINPSGNTGSPFPFLNPSFGGQQLGNEFQICELAIQCLEKGEVEIATKYIEQNTSHPVIRQKYFSCYAKKMIQLDVKNVPVVMAKGPYLISDEKEIRKTVVEALIGNQQFKAAYRLSKEIQKNIQEHDYLLELIASGLYIKKQFSQSKWVAEQMRQTGKSQDFVRTYIGNNTGGDPVVDYNKD